MGGSVLGDRRKRARSAWWAPLAGFLALLLCGCGSYPLPAILGSPSPVPSTAGLGGQAPRGQAGPASTGGGPTYAALGGRALRTLEREYYDGAGKWNLCVPLRCSRSNRDWGADSLTFVLFLHWALTGDPGVARIMNALTATAPSTHSGGSDVPLWDSIAAAREYQVTGNPAALRLAVSDFGYVAGNASRFFALGACPGILYQHRHGGGNKLKTLETGSNYIKAALLLYEITHRRSYLAQAEDQYQAVRRYFLSATVPLYTVYVFDNKSTCQQVPAQYFASVNGTMIWDGYTLAQVTGDRGYLSEAIATARAVAAHLGDATGVYADLQAENDVAEPLIEAMYDLAAFAHQGFARRWLLAAASASAASVAARTGAYQRFFDGPPSRAPVTAWQVNGGLALAQVAAALDPGGRPAGRGFWAGAPFVADNLTMTSSPVRFTFTGRAVAIIGTIGDQCCEAGHAQLLIDGAQTFDQTGIWQNKSSSGIPIPGSMLFAWRWPGPGRHTIEITPAVQNAKQGGSYFHMIGYYVVK
jgi:Glycosyl hydrolase family 76